VTVTLTSVEVSARVGGERLENVLFWRPPAEDTLSISLVPTPRKVTVNKAEVWPSPLRCTMTLSDRTDDQSSVDDEDSTRSTLSVRSIENELGRSEAMMAVAVDSLADQGKKAVVLPLP
jgi:hypothetical protein